MRKKRFLSVALSLVILSVSLPAVERVTGNPASAKAAGTAVLTNEVIEDRTKEEVEQNEVSIPRQEISLNLNKETSETAVVSFLSSDAANGKTISRKGSNPLIATVSDVGAMVAVADPLEPEVPFQPVPIVSYRTHIQTYGWETGWKSDGQLSGTVGQAKRLEGIAIKLSNLPVTGGISYRTHVQTYGWENSWKLDGAMSGTSGQAKRLEAIQIKLTGKIAEQYDVYYRVHAQTYGWLGWAKNGESAGTAGYAKRLEGIEVALVEKGGSTPGSTQNAYVECKPDITYRTHVQTYGWQGWKINGTVSGTIGLAKRLEGIQMSLTGLPCMGGISYRTHIQTYGWETDWKSNGEVSGTVGLAKRLEAIEIKLTGEIAEKYDVYYRVHAQTYGWLGWAKNGESAGTAGLAKRLEAIEICIVEKGGTAPGTFTNHFISK